MSLAHVHHFISYIIHVVALFISYVMILCHVQKYVGDSRSGRWRKYM